MSRKGDHDIRKQQIRAAAVRCFVQRGFSATRLIDIADRAGLSKGGVYFYYRTKEALFEAVLAARQADIEHRWGPQESGERPEYALERLVALHLRQIEDEIDDTRLGQMLATMAPRDDAYRHQLERALAVITASYRRVIAQGVSEGVFAGDPDQLASLVVAMVSGLATQCAADPDGRLHLSPRIACSAVLSIVEGGARAPLGRHTNVRDHEPSQPSLQS